MNLLVTGGAGFIGSNFIRQYLKNHPDDKITNLDFLTYAGNLDNLVEVEGNSNYEFVKGDICDSEIVNKVVEGKDVIVNFAAETHVDNSIKNSTDFIRTNVLGTRTLLEAAKNNGNIRFHHVSTDEVYGALSESDEKFNEKTSYDPRSPYSASKAASDFLVRSYFHTHNLPITISNCSNNYGHYMHPEKFIPLAITNIMQGKKIPVYGNGKNIRDWIHVNDHNRGVELILEKGKIGETYCLGGDNELRNIDIAKMIIKFLEKGEDMIEFVEDRKGHDFRYAIDFSKAENELDWKPSVKFEEGLQDMVAWYQDNIEWWEKVK